jgi:hypothetical protein
MVVTVTGKIVVWTGLLIGLSTFSNPASAKVEIPPEVEFGGVLASGNWNGYFEGSLGGALGVLIYYRRHEFRFNVAYARNDSDSAWAHGTGVSFPIVPNMKWFAGSNYVRVFSPKKVFSTLNFMTAAQFEIAQKLTVFLGGGLRGADLEPFPVVELEWRLF